MINVVFCVEVNTLGFFLDSHDGEAHVNAAVELPFLNLDDDTHQEKHASSYTGPCSVFQQQQPCIFYRCCGSSGVTAQKLLQGILILTSAMHLPYFRMPLSREKYLCREKRAQSVSASINSSVCNIPDNKSEVMAVSMRS